MNNLVNDFIEKASGDTKEIPVDSNDVHMLKTMMPTELAMLEVDMTWLHEQPLEAVSNLYNRLMKDKYTMYAMISDLAHHGNEYSEAIHDAIIGKATELSESLHFELSYESLDSVGNLFCMIINVLTYVNDLIQYIEAYYDIQVVDDTPGEIPPADDNEDEHMADMITSEFMDATGGEEFTDEELYGDTNKEPDTEYIPPMMGRFTTCDDE